MLRSGKTKVALGAAVSALAVAAAFWLAPWALGELQETRTWEAVRHGGYVVYVRHADRHSGARETLGASSPLNAFADCAFQRNLTAEGRVDARNIGLAFQSMKVPVGRVIALPLCRTRETALLAFGKAELDPHLYDARYVRHLFTVSPDRGNVVIVDTEDQVRQVAGVNLKPGEAAVFRPTDRGGFKFVGKLDQDDLDR